MEQKSIEVLGKAQQPGETFFSITPLLQYSTTPVFPHRYFADFNPSGRWILASAMVSGKTISRVPVLDH
jgi:hypothetical protein